MSDRQDIDHVTWEDERVVKSRGPAEANRLHIRVDIDYQLNGEQIEYLKSLAEKAIEYLFGNGMFTGESHAEITKWRCFVAPPRDKHVLVHGNFSDGYKVFGVFDGADQARAACANRDDFVARLQEVTPNMRERIKEAIDEPK